MPSNFKETPFDVKSPIVVRSTPKITLVGRGRAEKTVSLFAVSSREKISEMRQSDSVALSRRAPILADEGVGTLVIPKLPLEEMSMATRTLRAIQEEHSSIVPQASEPAESAYQRVARVESVTTNEPKPVVLSSAEPSTSFGGSEIVSDEKLMLLSTLTCIHTTCQTTFDSVEDFISHLVSFHCQHQFGPRKLTFVSLEKFEDWKASYENAFETAMVEHSRWEENGIEKSRYICTYCIVRQQGVDGHHSRMQGRSSAICPANFTVSHIRGKSHPEKMSPSGDGWENSPCVQRDRLSMNQCKYCGKWFGSKATIDRHMREQHTEPNPLKGTTIECGDPSCDVVCDRMSTLCDHVAHDHGRDDLLVEEFRFVSINEFKRWKERIEAETMSKYVLSSSRTRDNGLVQSYFLCHLSGYAYRSRHFAIRGSRMRTTKKMGRYCTAFMNVKYLSDGTVQVIGCLGHFGHELDVRQLPLPTRVKDEVSELLMQGIDTQKVMEIVRKNYSSCERGYHLRRYEVRNIADRLKKEGLILPKERDTTACDTTVPHGDETEKLAQDTTTHLQHGIKFQSLRSPLGSGSVPTSQITAGKLRDELVSSDCTESVKIAGGRRVTSEIADDEKSGTTMYVDETQICKRGSTMISTQAGNKSFRLATSAKLVPLLMEPQPTGNVDFDETMAVLKSRMKDLYGQMKQPMTVNEKKILLDQVRDLQAQLVRRVPQTTAFVQRMSDEYGMPIQDPHDWSSIRRMVTTSWQTGFCTGPMISYDNPPACSAEREL